MAAKLLGIQHVSPEPSHGHQKGKPIPPLGMFVPPPQSGHQGINKTMGQPWLGYKRWHHFHLSNKLIFVIHNHYAEPRLHEEVPCHCSGWQIHLSFYPTVSINY